MRLRNQRGDILITVLVVAGLLAVILIGLLSISTMMMRSVTRTTARAAIDAHLNYITEAFRVGNMCKYALNTSFSGATINLPQLNSSVAGAPLAQPGDVIGPGVRVRKLAGGGDWAFRLREPGSIAGVNDAPDVQKRGTVKIAVKGTAYNNNIPVYNTYFGYLEIKYEMEGGVTVSNNPYSILMAPRQIRLTLVTDGGNNIVQCFLEGSYQQLCIELGWSLDPATGRCNIPKLSDLTDPLGAAAYCTTNAACGGTCPISYFDGMNPTTGLPNCGCADPCNHP